MTSAIHLTTGGNREDHLCACRGSQLTTLYIHSRRRLQRELRLVAEGKYGLRGAICKNCLRAFNGRYA